MPLQNRVDPFGELFRTSARGTMMGNRGGALHNSDREIIRCFKSRRWITCVLQFRGRHRIVMSERRYTELFFLDEAVAFAAGHRPCAECRRERFNAFRHSWRRSSGQDHLPMADEMDLELHPARIDRFLKGEKSHTKRRSAHCPTGASCGSTEALILSGTSGLFFGHPKATPDVRAAVGIGWQRC